MASRAIKNFLKRRLYSTFRAGERLGWHLVPVNYYSPMSRFDELERTRDQ